MFSAYGSFTGTVMQLKIAVKVLKNINVLVYSFREGEMAYPLELKLVCFNYREHTLYKPLERFVIV